MTERAGQQSCRFCGVVLLAWFPVPGVPDGAMLLNHVAQAYSAEVGRFLDQMHTTDDITPVIVQAFEPVEAWTAAPADGNNPCWEVTMALINCPECTQQISDQAEACPHCGRPMRERNQTQQNVVVVRSAKSRGVYIILGVLLGLLGIHNFYAGYYGRGAAQLIITILLGWFYVGLVITGLWALVEVCTVTNDANGDRMT